MSGSGCRVVVMAKAPRPGLAKSRLIPALGPEGAARLAVRFLDRALGQARTAAIGPVVLSVAPRIDDPAFDPWRDLPLEWWEQGEGDLGARMARALERALHDAPCALLIGTDAPSLQAVVLQRAATALDAHDAVFVPALDGGYVLVGLRRPLPGLFTGMTWSTPQVMADTRARLAAAGARAIELPPLADVDEPADLMHLPPLWR